MQNIPDRSPADTLERLAFQRVLVPLDGSALADSALVPAGALAAMFGADLERLTVAPDQDVPATILRSAADVDGTLLCLASHGRGGLPRAILGSVARAVVAGAGTPVLVVGPHYDPHRPLDGGPVLACVDGSAASEAIIPAAASWAEALGVPLGIVTVAEPLLHPLDHRPYHRLFGPDTDAGDYVQRLARQWGRNGEDAIALALYDPLGPADGLRVHLRTGTAGLLAVNTRPRAGAANLFGSRAAAIIRTSPVPVLVVARTD